MAFSVQMPALGESVLLLIGHRAALREFCCQRIRGRAAGLRYLPLLFATPKRNGAGRGDECDKRQCRDIWNAIGFQRIHQ